MKIVRRCVQCQSSFRVDHWDVARGRGKYCSMHCVYQMRSEEYRAEKRAKRERDNDKNYTSSTS